MVHGNDGHRRFRRHGVLVAMALATTLIPLAAPAAAQAPDSRDITQFACPSAQVPEDGFGDIPFGNFHEAAIDCVAWYGVTSGTTIHTYNPAQPVPRNQMASFIVRMVDFIASRTPSTTDGIPLAPAGNAFPCDVDTGAHFDAIQRLASAGLVKGTGDNAEGEACYAPDRPVSRAQMATFIAEAQRVLGQDLPASDGDFFVDDDEDTHEDKIDAITAARITEGTGTDPQGGELYSPGTNVARDQMASFLARTLDRLVDVTVAEPPPTATLSPTSGSVVGGADFEGTVTADRGTIDSVTVGGCSITPPEVFDVSNPAGAATLTFSVAIPADQGGPSCRLDVITTFVGGGRDTSNAVISVTAS